MNFANCILSKCLSNNAISALFVTFFLENEQMYLHEIEKIPTGSTLILLRLPPTLDTVESIMSG